MLVPCSTCSLINLVIESSCNLWLENWLTLVNDLINLSSSLVNVLLEILKFLRIKMLWFFAIWLLCTCMTIVFYTFMYDIFLQTFAMTKPPWMPQANPRFVLFSFLIHPNDNNNFIDYLEPYIFLQKKTFLAFTNVLLLIWRIAIGRSDVEKGGCIIKIYL